MIQYGLVMWLRKIFSSPFTWRPFRSFLQPEQALFGHNAVHTGSDPVSQRAPAPKKRKFTVAVEGNIGCGKSVLLDYFKKYPTVEALSEPVAQWTNIHGYNGLELLYEDPERWSFTFNNYVMLSRLRLHEHVSTRPVKMLERSYFSTLRVFVENSYRMKHLTGFEKAVMEDWHKQLMAMKKVNLDLIVYLRVSPEICYERIKSRNRLEEKSLSFDLLENLHVLYEDWLHHGETPAPVLVLDASPNITSMYDTYEQRKEDILMGCV